MHGGKGVLVNELLGPSHPKPKEGKRVRNGPETQKEPKRNQKETSRLPYGGGAGDGCAVAVT